MYLRGRRGGVRESGGKGLVCKSVLRVCFLVSVLGAKDGIRYTLIILFLFFILFYFYFYFFLRDVV